MKRKMLLVAIFSVSIFIIPLFALSNGQRNLQFFDDKTASMPSKETLQQPNPLSPKTEPITQGSFGNTLLVSGKDYRIKDLKTGKIFTVSPQEFVRGALAAEMPPTFHPEALKAQAVAAHTYAENLRRSNANKKYDLTADPQNWKSYTTETVFRERYGALSEAYWKAICTAADEVSGYLLAYEGEPIVAAYHSMSCGMTEDAANVWTGGRPYLVPVESRGDRMAPDYEHVERFSVKQMEAVLKAAFPGIKLGNDPTGWVTVVQQSESGYIMQVRVGETPIKGSELRTALGLRSSCFTVSCDGETFTFTVYGYGHGVGLSQYGADFMARQGSSFDEILAHYYPGTTLTLAVDA